LNALHARTATTPSVRGDVAAPREAEGIDSQVRVMSHELFRGHFLLTEKTLLSMRPTDVEPLEAGAR